MVDEFLKSIDGKRHVDEEINEALFFRNRFLKSGFIILSILGALSISHISDMLSVKLYSDLINYYTVMILILGVFILPYHFSHYGLNLKNLKLNLIIGIPLGVISSILVIIYRGYCAAEGIPGTAFAFEIKFTDIIYPLFVISQEVVMKGYIQGYFIILFGKGKFNQFIAILIASWIFAMLHSPFGLNVFLLVFAYAIATGYLYEKTRSVTGVSIIHFAAGASLYYFSSMT